MGHPKTPAEEARPCGFSCKPKDPHSPLRKERPPWTSMSPTSRHPAGIPDEGSPALASGQRPVHWSDADELWVVTRFADISYVSKHQELFTSAEGVRPALGSKLGLIDEAEPRHGHLRAMINRGFTPRMVKKLEETFLEITTEAIDSVAKSGECDFVHRHRGPLAAAADRRDDGHPQEGSGPLSQLVGRHDCRRRQLR